MTVVSPPKFSDPGPDLAIADLPEMPRVVADHLAAKGLRTLGDLRPLFEQKATADAECEPAAAVIKDLCGSLELFQRYKAGGAFIGRLGGRVHMLKMMSLWPRPQSPAHAVPGWALNDGAPLHPEPEPKPEPTLGPLAFPCMKCKVPAGTRCKNYLGKGKQPCPDRGRSAATPKPTSQFVPDLLAGFDEPPSPPPVPTPAPAPVVKPQPADNFDETTPPPRKRPVGEPVARHVELPPGEPVVELFRRWDKDGRIPPECILGEMGRDGWVLVAAVGQPPVTIGEVIAAPVLERFQLYAGVHLKAGRFPEVPRLFAVFEPITQKGAR